MFDGRAVAHASLIPPDELLFASTSDSRADAYGMPRRAESRWPSY